MISFYLKWEETQSLSKRKDFMTVTDWFYQNRMVVTHKNCHYMCISKNIDQDNFTFKNLPFTKQQREENIGATIDNKLNFNTHIKKSVEKLFKKLELSPGQLDTLKVIKGDSFLIALSDHK